MLHFKDEDLPTHVLFDVKAAHKRQNACSILIKEMNKLQERREVCVLFV